MRAFNIHKSRIDLFDLIIGFHLYIHIIFIIQVEKRVLIEYDVYVCEQHIVVVKQAVNDS